MSSSNTRFPENEGNGCQCTRYVGVSMENQIARHNRLLMPDFPSSPQSRCSEQFTMSSLDKSCLQPSQCPLPTNSSSCSHQVVQCKKKYPELQRLPNPPPRSRKSHLRLMSQHQKKKVGCLSFFLSVPCTLERSEACGVSQLFPCVRLSLPHGPHSVIAPRRRRRRRQ